MSDSSTVSGDLEPVSVIIPVYNGERYLREALDSVLGQTHSAVEIIVVDDGSTDGSADIVRSASGPIRYVRQSNAGTANARNRGVEISTGAFLAFLDQDDLWEPAKLAIQMRVFSEHPGTQAVFGMVSQFHSPELPETFRQRIRCPAEPVAGYLPSAVVLRREAFFRVGPFAETWRLGEWADWFARYSELQLQSVLVPEVVARRRLHEGNKGLVLTQDRVEYARVVRAALTRRRSGLRSHATTGTDHQ